MAPPPIDKEPPPVVPFDLLDTTNLPEESRAPEFGIWDVFFWRDAPDWYFKTFSSAGFMLCFSAMRQYLDRHELEVFLPPRAKILPEGMRRGYRNREILKTALHKTGIQTTVAAGASAVLWGGAYYLGTYRGEHTWTDFTASGAAAGSGLALWLLWPPRLRTLAFGVALGAVTGSVAGLAQQATGQPFWDERRDFQGWWWGKWIDNKRDKREEEQRRAAAAAAMGAGAAAAGPAAGLVAAAALQPPKAGAQ